MRSPDVHMDGSTWRERTMRRLLDRVRKPLAGQLGAARIVDNIGWLFMEKFLRMAVGMLVMVWLARHLGPEGFGLLNFASAFTGLFAVFAALGLPTLVVRDIVREPASASLTLGTAGVLQLLAGLAGYVIILALIARLRPDDALARAVVAVLGSVALLKASEIAVYWFESKVQSKYVVVVQSAVFLAFAGVKLVLIARSAPLMAFAWAMLGEAVLTALVLMAALSRLGPPLRTLRVSTKRAGTLLRDAWPMVLAAVATTVYIKTDQIMLGQMAGDEAVGVYAAGLRLSEFWYFIPVAIVNSVYPSLLRTKERSPEHYQARMQTLYELMVLIGVGIAVVVTALAAPMMDLLFGESYAGADLVLSIHIWGGVFAFLGIASARWFVTENRQMLNAQRAIAGAVANIVLNLWLIPRMGVAGAASATVAAQLVTCWLYDALQAETRPMFLMKCNALNPANFTRLLLGRGGP